MRVLVFGATGTIGRATVVALVARGHQVVCVARRLPEETGGATWRVADVTDTAALARDGLKGERFDAVVSCLASRTGDPADAWAIDHRAHLGVLATAEAAGVGHFVLLSALCVQKPRLAFQHAKLAFEAALTGSGLRHSIVRPTAFFKSLSGQVARVQGGKPFLVFGDGRLTACKPISDGDLADYLAGCLEEQGRWNKILPIGGPGPAITPLDQAAMLARVRGREVPVRRVPVALMDAIIGGLRVAGAVWPKARAKAELARIGRYYATESMLVWDAAAGRYDAEATPEHGADRLEDFYARLVRGEVTVNLGDHAVF